MSEAEIDYYFSLLFCNFTLTNRNLYMKGINAYMKHVMEAADDAPLLYFGIPNKILTYSTVRNWFVKVTPKHFYSPLFLRQS